MSSEILSSRLRKVASEDTLPDPSDLTLALSAEDIALEELLEIAEQPRLKYFGRKMQIHILDNIRNGNCAEDCGYCAQRKSESATEISSYSLKQEEEILLEAERAYKSGAYRFCLVTAGTGPTERHSLKYADLIRKIKERYPMRLCLSAGIIRNPEVARVLAQAGLDRYNHNLNTSEAHTPNIVSTHTFADRVRTIEHLKDAGISVCSGVIAGMGETGADLADVATRLRSLNVPSIPVNFFLPIPGHEIKSPSQLSPEYCLRILSVFRIANPGAEIRAAAGRELHLKTRQPDALRVANSLFVSGYLNVKGSDARATYAMIRNAGYEVDAVLSDLDPEFRELVNRDRPGTDAENDSTDSPADGIRLKTIDELRTFAPSANNSLSHKG